MNKSKFCPVCGHKVPVQTVICPNCNHKFSDAVPHAKKVHHTNTTYQKQDTGAKTGTDAKDVFMKILYFIGIVFFKTLYIVGAILHFIAEIMLAIVRIL